MIQFLAKSSSSKLIEYTNYVYSEEITKKISRIFDGISSKGPFLSFIILIFSMVILAFMGESGLEIMKHAFALIWALFFVGLAIYNGFGVFLGYKLWEKVQFVFEDFLMTDDGNRQDNNTIKEDFFKEIYTQANINDSYLWSLIVFSIPLVLWGIMACLFFDIEFSSLLIIISFSLLLSIILPFQYVNYYIKKKSVSFLIKYDLHGYLNSLKEVLGFRNTILSISISLLAIVSFILSLIQRI